MIDIERAASVMAVLSNKYSLALVLELKLRVVSLEEIGRRKDIPILTAADVLKNLIQSGIVELCEKDIFLSPTMPLEAQRIIDSLTDGDTGDLAALPSPPPSPAAQVL